MSEVHDELRSAIDGLTDEQAKTLLGWAGVVRRDAASKAAGASIGALADTLGIVSDGREPGRSTMHIDVDPAWNNPNGVLHGGIVYTMVDYSMGGAVMASLPEGHFCTTIEAKINYLASVREGRLSVETTVVKEGRNIAFTESKVTDDTGRIVATASGSMFIFRPEGS